jgi:hypothetical protein
MKPQKELLTLAVVVLLSVTPVFAGDSEAEISGFKTYLTEVGIHPTDVEFKAGWDLGEQWFAKGSITEEMTKTATAELVNQGFTKEQTEVILAVAAGRFLEQGLLAVPD